MLGAVTGEIAQTEARENATEMNWRKKELGEGNSGHGYRFCLLVKRRSVRINSRFVWQAISQGAGMYSITKETTSE